jgi:sugar O-acyltransferase (sialic acid O-acetyltransferase NeuD family)
MKKLAIIGSGDLGQQLSLLALQTGMYLPVGYYDDFAQAGQFVHSLPVMGKLSQIMADFSAQKFDALIMGIGYAHFEFRKHTFESLSQQIPFASLVHPSCVIDPSAKIGAGVILHAGCIVSINAEIQENVLLYDGSIIAHDSVIGQHSILSPGTKISGFSSIGECVNLGTGTIVIDHIQIADHSRTGAGAVVVKNIDQPGLYLGCPAKLH